jgi:hypothetical protein
MSSRPPVDRSRQTLESSVRDLCESLSTIAKSLSECAKRLKRGGSLTLMSQELSNATAILSSIAKLSEQAHGLAEECMDVSNRDFLEVETRLRELCSKKGWRIDGQWPDFIVDYGISVHIDEAKRQVTLEGKTTGLDDLEASLAEHNIRLLPKKFSADQFIRKIAEAYDAAPKAKGSSVPIFELYRQLVILLQSSRFWRDASADSFSPLSIAQFRAQFSRMLEAGVHVAPDGRALRLLPPLDPKDGVFIYQPAERRFGFVGRIDLSSI